MNRRSAALRLLAVLAAPAGGAAGCFSASAQKSPTVQFRSDTIFALGRPDAATAKALQMPDAVALLGETNTYLMMDGGALITQVVEELDGSRVSLGDTRSFSTHVKDGKKLVWGPLHIVYAAPASGVFSEKEIAALSRMYFTKTATGYERRLGVNGIVLQPIQIDAGQMRHFTRRREITLREDVPPQITADQVARLGADIITFPIQVVVITAGVVIFTIAFAAAGFPH